MSDVSESGPGSPEDFTQVSLEKAYINLLEGIVLLEMDDLRNGANLISASDKPLASEIRDGARRLEDAFLGNQSNQAYLMNNLFRDGVRSYVYSGLEVSPNLVRTTATIMTISIADLKDIVNPADIAKELKLGKVSRQEKRNLAYTGRQNIVELGLASWAIKLAFGLKLY